MRVSARGWCWIGVAGILLVALAAVLGWVLFPYFVHIVIGQVGVPAPAPPPRVPLNQCEHHWASQVNQRGLPAGSNAGSVPLPSASAARCRRLRRRGPWLWLPIHAECYCATANK